MADLDAELMGRVARWCAEAGRQAGAGAIRRALSPLSWDELLALRALLADSPPARPLGPFALADMARGAPPDVAAEREREGRYRGEEEVADAGDAAPIVAAPSPPPPPRRRTSPRRKGAAIVIRRARERAEVPPPAPPAPPDVVELRRPEGRAVLERLVRRHGGKRAALVGALCEGWRRGDGSSPGDAELDALLDHHGLARAFARRERDEVLHAVRAEGGIRAAAAARLGLDAAGLDAAVVRLGVAREAEQIREQRRADLRARATLAGRARLLLDDEERLRDLGLLEEVERDLRARLPEHVRALRATQEPLPAALALSLSIPRAAAEALARRCGVDLGRVTEARTSGTSRAGARPRGAASGRSGPGRSGPGRSGPGRSGPGRSGPGRSGPGRSSPGRSGPGRSSPGRSGPGRFAPGPGPGSPGPGRSGPGRGGPDRAETPRRTGPRPGAGDRPPTRGGPRGRPPPRRPPPRR